MLSDEKLTELRSKYGLLPLMALLRAVAEAAVQEDRKSRHLKERAQLEAEWSQLRAMTAAVQDSTTVTVRYDLSPTEVESVIRDKLIAMGWIAPITQVSEDIMLLFRNFPVRFDEADVRKFLTELARVSK